MEQTPMTEQIPVEEISQAEIPANETPAEDVRPVELVTVCDIQFRNNSKIYYFSPGELQVKAEDDVIIETSRGLEFGHCVKGNHTLPIHETVAPLRPVIRIATEQDKSIDRANREKEKKAFQICMKKIEELKLDMQLVSAECAFDGSKILFFFTADERVDFRELVKLLGYALHNRIELRQIGVRDKAKMVGGLGICGRPFCCGQFLQDFQPVSIKMAKTQNLSLNPTKISGTCGRLMCCLNYEQAAYEDLHRTSPKADSFVDTPDGRGTITEVNLLKQSVKVRLEKQPDTIVCHKNCDICVLRSGKAKKTDEPIPDDLAPISGGKQEKKQEKPSFSAYLDPNFQKKNDGAEDKKANRRSKLGKPQRQGDAIEQELKAPVKEAKAPAKETKVPLKEVKAPKAVKEAPAPTAEEEAAPKAPKKNNYKNKGKDFKKKSPNDKPKEAQPEGMPAEQAPKKEQAPKEQNNKANGEQEGASPAPRKPHHHYHHYHKRRKPGAPKSEG